ncbi:V-type ATP synthase subunit E [Fusobacterium pseudoperiodonticum]|uniref:V-type proton ATPase subunit E n=1 Tax=Fusobacterium pseudoperiodonticum TaxID=2663009 RepID=A0AAD0F0W6_9FUSO|nr:V-type ATP synthase subunit E [Fusobacterium pseudoperiodonticum]ATV36055.1 V-type ATP synthase subunit E [Fusobacterium pseudoperiodonticum]ATV61041.1 V-type ATP synthase subunit E [Fusobacterium pseudoperiodonticum]
MSNLDNLVAEILQQAQKEANRMLTKAKTENSEFSEKENKKVQKEVEAIKDKATEEAQALKERVISNANLKSRDMILQAKEELVDDILERVLERLKNIDTKKYLKFVENILKNLNLSKNAEVIVSKDMRLALGDKILDYRISDQTVESGCSIKDGNLIYNNEFSNLIEFNREELEREILNKIFE